MNRNYWQVIWAASCDLVERFELYWLCKAGGYDDVDKIYIDSETIGG
jgi:hypothetical protein